METFVHRRACAGLLIACVALCVSRAAEAAEPPSASGAPQSASGASQVAASSPELPGPVLSLAELLAFAEQNSPLLHVAERERAYGAAAREAAEPFLLDNPQLQIWAGPRYREGASDYDVIVQLEQPLELAGAASKNRDAAARLDQRARAELHAARFEVRRAIVLAYRRAVVARGRADVARRMADFESRLLTVAQRRLSAGDVSAIEVRMAQADAAEATARALLTARELEAARIQLAQLSGYSLSAPPNVPAGLDRQDAVPSLAALLREARAQHPELALAKSAVAEAEARELLAESHAWPKTTVGVSFQREGAPLAELPAYIFLGTIGLELPVFQRNQAERGRARADREVARSQEVLTERNLEARIVRAHGDLVSAKARLDLQTTTVTATLEDNLTLLQRGFEAGEISLMDVSVARARFLRAQEVAIDAAGDYLEALSALETALGRELTSTRVGGQK